MARSSRLTVRTITAAEHRAYVTSRPSVPLEQTPGWARGFVTVRSESVGWFDNDRLIGAGLFRYRGLPRLPMRSVAVFDSGPDIDWTGLRRPALSLADWLDPLVAHLHGRGIFSVRVNPVVTSRTWSRTTPDQRSRCSDLALLEPDPVSRGAELTKHRLGQARWRPMTDSSRRYQADVPLDPGPEPPVAVADDIGRELSPGLETRVGTIADIPAVQEAQRRIHPRTRVPSDRSLRERWHALASDNVAGVKIIVVGRQHEVVYGSLLVAVGTRAWDLSPALSAPHAHLPEVIATRNFTMELARYLGARWLTVPTELPVPEAPLPAPVAGWPPARLTELVGTWQFPVRATWHLALSPIVDRLPL